MARFTDTLRVSNVGSVRVSHLMRALRRYGNGQRPHAGVMTDKLTSETCRNTTAPCALAFREPVHSWFAQARFAFPSVSRVVSPSVAFATPSSPPSTHHR